MSANRPFRHPSALASCSECAGVGYVVTRKGEVATAEPCSCAQKTTCPACGGSQWVRPPGDRRGPVSRCQCFIVERRLRGFVNAHLPGRLSHCTFDNFVLSDPRTQAEAFGTARALAAGFKPGGVNRGFVMWGPVGRGKTHLLAATLRTLTLEHGVACEFIEFSHLLSRLKGRFDRGEGAAAVLDRLVEVEVLAIDELGKGMLTEWELSVVDELVSRRYNAARTILATTNYKPGPPTGHARPNLADPRPEMQPSLSDRVGERVFSRLGEMCELRYLGGEDWRLKQAVRW